jgi:molybdate-binding protein
MEASLKTLNHEAAGKPARTAVKPVVMHASHDLALAGLRDSLVLSGNTTLELHFRGSIECLASLAHGDCDIAGFHMPGNDADRTAYAPYRPWLKTRSLRLVRFVSRRQGLMVAQGNPKRLLSLADLADKGARFVNRQPDSGTRLCFDRLLASARIRPDRINGYQTEEFTHAAIAATIASGMADAGFGIEAAARQHGLDFVPLADENYFLATRAATLARSEVRLLLEKMKETAFLQILKTLPGYDAADIGDIILPREAPGAPESRVGRG